MLLDPHAHFHGVRVRVCWILRPTSMGLGLGLGARVSQHLVGPWWAATSQPREARRTQGEGPGVLMLPQGMCSSASGNALAPALGGRLLPAICPMPVFPNSIIHLKRPCHHASVQSCLDAHAFRGRHPSPKPAWRSL